MPPVENSPIWLYNQSIYRVRLHQLHKAASMKLSKFQDQGVAITTSSSGFKDQP